MEDQWLNATMCVHKVEIISYERAVMNTAGVFCMTTLDTADLHLKDQFFPQFRSSLTTGLDPRTNTY